MNRTIDLNADLAESDQPQPTATDLTLLELITSANIACGFHAGGPALMKATCRAAQARGVRIGAQVSYDDRAGFGRRDMDIPAARLTADVRCQIDALSVFAEVAYIKPHGALYNRVVWDEPQAAAIVDAVMACNNQLPLLGLPGSLLLKLAREAGLPAIEEGFADRAYTADGRLVPRSQPGAVITDPDDVKRHAVALARSGRVRTLCVHGDTSGAVDLAREVRRALQNAGFTLAAFT